MSGEKVKDRRADNQVHANVATDIDDPFQPRRSVLSLLAYQSGVCTQSIVEESDL